MVERDWVEAVLTPRDDDSSDVRWALETALAMWSRAERDQALRWLVNAVQSATTEGAKARAEAIGRAAAELERRPAPVKRGSRPPPAGNVPGSTTQPDGGERTAPLGADADGPVTHKRPGKHRTVPYKIPPDEVTNLFAPDSGLLEALRAAEPEPAAEAEAISDTPVPAPVPARPRPPKVMTDGLDATLTNVRPKPPPRDHVEQTVVMDADEIAAPSRSLGTSAPATMASLQKTLEPMRALRVVVQSGSGREIVLRLLDGNEPVPPGQQEALLIAFERKD